ncbi:spermidine synthase [Castellaniella sp. FW104-16D08]|uniref:spermidine synthase n=1 Tax=unclassified Castellaniella TaxID=2617606 RepID=UPI003314D19C
MAHARKSRSRPQSAWEDDEPTLSEEAGIRFLHFNSEWIQGAMRVARPSELVLAYTQQMMAWLLFVRPGSRDSLAILGLGAGSLLRFSMRHTRSAVDTVERNPAVTAMCRVFFRLPAQERSVIHHADALDWVADPARAGRYRALMVDVYDSHAQGPVCDTPAFYQDCYRILDEPGVMTVNLFGQHASFERNLQAIDHAFNGQFVCLPEVDEGNTVVLAFKGHVLSGSAQDLMDRAAALETATRLPARRWARSLLSQLAQTEAASGSPANGLVASQATRSHPSDGPL